MTPNSNSDNEINVWCDWLTDNGQNSDEIRFEEIQDYGFYWIYRINGTDMHVGPVYEFIGLVGTNLDYPPNRTGSFANLCADVGGGGLNAVGDFWWILH